MSSGWVWRKATASNPSGNCVEVGVWQTSSFCSTNSCVEVAGVTSDHPAKAGEPIGVAVRDSKDREGPQLLFTSAEWLAFISGP